MTYNNLLGDYTIGGVIDPNVTGIYFPHLQTMGRGTDGAYELGYFKHDWYAGKILRETSIVFFLLYQTYNHNKNALKITINAENQTTLEVTSSDHILTGMYMGGSSDGVIYPLKCEITGLTPGTFYKFTINNDEWFGSTDNGTTWTQTGSIYQDPIDDFGVNSYYEENQRGRNFEIILPTLVLSSEISIKIQDPEFGIQELSIHKQYAPADRFNNDNKIPPNLIVRKNGINYELLSDCYRPLSTSRIYNEFFVYANDAYKLSGDYYARTWVPKNVL